MKIFAFIVCVLCLPGKPSYKDMYRNDYRNALYFIKQHKTEINNSSEQYHNSNVLLVAVVFPEIIRYSYFKDFFETAALELLYTEYGSEYADFSIGRFQMKPSFAEKVESYLSGNTCLYEKYQCLLKYKQKKSTEVRQERLTRLKSLKWQLIYANCFINIIDDKYNSEIFSNEEQKVLFYATAYNHGFDKDAEDIRKWQNIKTFPYGMKDDHNPFSYAEVAADFYVNVSNDVLKVNDQKVLTNK